MGTSQGVQVVTRGYSKVLEVIAPSNQPSFIVIETWSSFRELAQLERVTGIEPARPAWKET